MLRVEGIEPTRTKRYLIYSQTRLLNGLYSHIKKRTYLQNNRDKNSINKYYALTS